ncbi:hypothetical protein [Coleofasciculus sp. F4-SAH-05]|uniref:hypothetical protein n=1 Tax=Coleofasciculus sp. F4-SAH-05 TaxID=3069525 RepID=UPI0032FC2521
MKDKFPNVLYPLHPTPYTLHPTPYTLHPTPYTLHPVSAIIAREKLAAPLLSPETLPDGIPEKLFIYRNMENEGDLSKGKT